MLAAEYFLNTTIYGRDGRHDIKGETRSTAATENQLLCLLLIGESKRKLKKKINLRQCN